MHRAFPVSLGFATAVNIPEQLELAPKLLSDRIDGQCGGQDEGTALLQYRRKYIAVCGNYVGPNYCNGVAGTRESACFPLEKTHHPFRDRVAPRDCADACAQQHDYCCHHRIGECDDCILGNWSDDCTGGLERCLQSCRDEWRRATSIAKLQGPGRATKGRCGECHMDALIEVFRNWSSAGRSCAATGELFRNAVHAASFGLKIDQCRKKDNPWPLRFANFHNYSVKVSMPRGQRRCRNGLRFFRDINLWRTEGERDYLLLPSGETMDLTDDSVNARMTDVLWHAEECKFDVRDARNNDALVQLRVSFGRKPPLEAIRHMCHVTRWHRRWDQNIGIVLSSPKAPDGRLGEFDNPGCTVCLCSDSIHCHKHCHRYQEPA